MKKIKKLSLAGVSLIGFGLSGVAMAGLYVYPVKSYSEQDKNVHDQGNNMAYHSDVNHQYKRDASYQSGHEMYRGKEMIHKEADMTLNNQQQLSHRLPCFGRNVPAQVALTEILGKHYVINIDDRVSSTRISWSGGETCETKNDIIRLINNQNDIHISLNDDEKVAGVSSSSRHSIHFAHANPQVWVADPAKSLTENLTIWAEQDGWKVQWPNIMEKIDFETAGTTLYGELPGVNGVFHRVLNQIAENHPNVTLSIKFTANGYIVVTEGGYTNKIMEKK